MRSETLELIGAARFPREGASLILQRTDAAREDNDFTSTLEFRWVL